MGECSWPSGAELDKTRRMVAQMYGRDMNDVRVVVSPYRICPLGAHIDHQGGTVSAMTINRGILLGFVPSSNSQIKAKPSRQDYLLMQNKLLISDVYGNVGNGYIICPSHNVILRSGQFKGEVSFSVGEVQYPRKSVKINEKTIKSDSSKVEEECSWGNYARGALYALQSRGTVLTHGISGFICGSDGLDSSGLSSSAAIGVAYLLALETANNLTVSPNENIEYDRLIENEYLGLRNGILDQSAILLSSYGCLTYMDCKTKQHKLINPPKTLKSQEAPVHEAYKILLAFSGLKQALTNNPGYNRRVTECREAASVLLHASGNDGLEPLLSNVSPEDYDTHKHKLEPDLARRAEHYFSENKRVTKGLEAWASGKLEDFGALISASGLSSIQNYECGSKPLIQLYEILQRAPGIFGARFSGAGFRGCCVAFVDANRASEAATFVVNEYCKVQPELTRHMNQDTAVVMCEAGDSAHVL